MDNKVVTGSAIKLTINRKNILRYLGYSADIKPSARISSLIKDYVEEAYHVIEPSYNYAIRDIDRVEDSDIYVEGSIVFHGEVVARLLEKCDKVALFVATIGSHLGEVANQLAEDGLIVQAYTLDAIGSDAVEQLSQSVQDLITKSVRSIGLVTSRRYSPGYCDWDISQQDMLFRAVNGESIGIQLTEDNLMVPEKSISGIIGIGPINSDIKDYNPCETCSKQDCPGRR